jgi:hypothetical protein
MKLLSLMLLIAASACTSYEHEIVARLEAEADFHAHQKYLEEMYTGYDLEYIDDCLTYVELVCEFE